MQKRKKLRSFLYLAVLILAGESVFLLPFVLQRVFKATFLDTLQIDDIQLGNCFAVYGIVALLSYLFGGVIADRFSPRLLMGISLWMTAAGGIYLATVPTYDGLYWLYAFWGFSTIFLFWAPLIKATRMWGQGDHQGKAFGFLDGGRGMVAAFIGTVGVWLFSQQSSEVDGSIQATTFSQIAYIVSGVVFVAGILAFVFLKGDVAESAVDRMKWSEVPRVLQIRTVWLFMVMVLCAYCGYKLSDNFSQYARDVMGYTDTEAATVGTLILFARPVIGFSIGMFLPERWMSRAIIIGFALMGVFSGLLAMGIAVPGNTFPFISFTLLVALGVFIARIMYFSLFRQGKIPLHLMGTAVGLISTVGFTPDVFWGAMAGRFVKYYPGIEGHQYVFAMGAGFALLGVGASLVFHRWSRAPKSPI